MLSGASGGAGRFPGLPFLARHFAPPDVRRGGLVLVHDQAGLGPAPLAVAAAFAEGGYECLALCLGEPEGALGWDRAAVDIQAAIDALVPPVFAVGFGWGGAAAWLAACRCRGLAAAASYCGARIAELRSERPACPIVLHFARLAPGVQALAEAIEAAHPQTAIHLYAAAEGFALGAVTGAADAARLARLRTLQLFARAAGGRGEAGG